MEYSRNIERLVYELFRKLYLQKRSTSYSTQGKILKILYLKGDISQKDIQDKLQIQSGTMSEVINKLENKGLLVRQRDENDRRKVILHLTEEGKADVEAYQQQYQEDTSSFFDVLSIDESQEFQRILYKLLNER